MTEPLTSYFEQAFGLPGLEKKRAKTEKAQVGLRLPEPLRARLEKEAKESGCSLNFEIVKRLEQSIRDDDLGNILFGDRDIFIMVSFIGRIVRLMERKRDKKLRQDPAIFRDALGAATAFWNHYCKSAEEYIDNSTADLDDFVEDTLAELRRRTAEQDSVNA